MTLAIKATRGAVAGNGWTNAGNAVSDNGIYATAAPAQNGSITGDWDFAAFTDGEIPVGSTINSVTIRANYNVNVTNSIASLGTQAGNNGSFDAEEMDASEPTADADFDVVFNAAPSETDLKTAGRLVGRIRAIRGNSMNAVTFSLDYVELRVDYTEPAEDVTGSQASTEGDDAATASGLVEVTGAQASTEAADSAAASGLVEVTGSQASTEANDTAAASGQVGDAGVTGSQASTEDDDSASASGLVSVIGAASATEGADSAAASGIVEVIGSSAITEGDDSAAASGQVLQNVEGTSAIVEEDDTASAAGQVGEEPVSAEPETASAGSQATWIHRDVVGARGRAKRLKKMLEEQAAAQSARLAFQRRQTLLALLLAA